MSKQRKRRGPSMMDRARAARAIIDAQRTQRSAENLNLFGFMAIFHPEIPEKKVRELTRDLRRNRG